MSFIKFLMEQQADASPGVITDDETVLVQGIGQMRVGQIQQQVVNMLKDAANRAESGDVDWKSVKWMLGHSALHAYVDTLVKLQEEENS